MPSRRIVRIGVALVAVCVTVVTAAPAGAQPATGTISGIATDETGAAIPDVRIAVTNDATALRREITTGPEGTFTIPMLPAGRYTLRAERDGFAAHDLAGIVVDANDQVTLQVQLKVAGLSEAVTVTAQKREERAQDVPMSLSLLDAAPLASTSQLVLRDYYSRVPGLSVSPSYLGNQMLAIRGVTTGGFTIPTVGVTIDDVTISSYTNNEVPDLDAGDLSRIEVLRGPQGTLYGANSMGGLIKYITVEPSTASVSGGISVGTNGVYNGEQLGHKVRTHVNLPVTDTFAVRLSGYKRQDPGYIENPVHGLDAVNRADAYGGRVDALWRGSRSTSLRLNALYQSIDANGSSEIDRRPDLRDLQQGRVPGSGESKQTIHAFSAVLATRLAGAKLTSITGYNANRHTGSFDWSSTFGEIVQPEFGASGVLFAYDTDGARLNQELRVEFASGKAIEWLLGAFYTFETTDYLRTMPVVAATAADVVGEYWRYIEAETYSEYAVFANATYRITDALDVQIGARFSKNDRENEGSFQSRTLGGPSDGPLIGAATTYNDEAITYLATPRLRITPALMVYGRFASGYRPGGPNLAASVGAGAPPQFSPDTTYSYEAGIKSQLLRNTLAIDASLFYIDWKDIQLQQRLPNLFTYTANGSRAKSEGVELAAVATLPAGLSLSGSFTYNNAVLTEDLPPASPDFGAAGDRLPNSARSSGSASVEKLWPLRAQAALFAAGTVSYVGDRYSIFRATASRQRLPAYQKTDLRAGVRTSSWSITAFVNNLTDERGLLNGGDGYILPFAYLYITPRVVGVDLSFHF